MDPISLALGAGAGFVGSKLLDSGKNKTTSASKRKPAAKKTTSTKRKSTSTTGKKKIRKHPGINQTTGRLKKGYKYGKNGSILKAKSC